MGARVHDQGPLVQGLDHRACPEIGVGAGDLVHDRVQRLTRLHVLEMVSGRDEVRQPRQDVVTLHHTDTDPFETHLPRHLEDPRAAGFGVESPGVGDHPHTPLVQLG
jgi:hypothetical protein